MDNAYTKLSIPVCLIFMSIEGTQYFDLKKSDHGALQECIYNMVLVHVQTRLPDWENVLAQHVLEICFSFKFHRSLFTFPMYFKNSLYIYFQILNSL